MLKKFCLFLLILSLAFPRYLPAEDDSASLSDDAFLEMVQEKSFRFFQHEHNPHNGLVRDSTSNHENGFDNAPASIAATGFALTAYGVAVEHGWMSRASAYTLTVRTLEFLLRQAAQHHGFFYHFLDIETGQRVSQSELSPIDTALCLAGALFAAEYFDDAKIRDLVRELYERIDFPWMTHGGKTLALAWSPETGFHKQRWDRFDESLLLYVLAIGSPTHPIPAESWKEISRPVGSYRDYRMIQMPPLFTHQYPHIWLDLRNKNDGLADYFQNSVNASLANRAFCMDQAKKYSTYGPNSWGLTASDGPFGYRAYGAPPGWSVLHDGTVAPTGCGASIVFTPKESIACMRFLYENYKKDLWGMYGFSDAFNRNKKWYSSRVLAIDQGPILLMIENYRTGLIWKTLNKNKNIQNALQKIGFKAGTMPLPWPDPPQYQAPYVPEGIQIDGFLRDWPRVGVITLEPSLHKEFGRVNGDELKAEIRFAWDEKMLYFIAKITDEEMIVKRAGKNIWRDDLLELYIDPEDNGLYWGDAGDFQLGFRPGQGDRPLETWSWFQGGEDPSETGRIVVQGFSDQKGYILEGGILWDYLGIRPQTGEVIRLSPAVHNVSRNGGDSKLQWFFRNEKDYQRFELGKITLAGNRGPNNAKTEN